MHLYRSKIRKTNEYVLDLVMSLYFKYDFFLNTCNVIRPDCYVCVLCEQMNMLLRLKEAASCSSPQSYDSDSNSNSHHDDILDPSLESTLWSSLIRYAIDSNAKSSHYITCTGAGNPNIESCFIYKKNIEREIYMRQNSAVLQFSFYNNKIRSALSQFLPQSISAVTLAKFYGQKDSLSVVNDVWNRAQTIHFQTKRWIRVTNLNLLRNLRRSIFLPLHEIPDYMDSYWNDWISPTKIHQTSVNVTVPYLLEKLSHTMQCSFVLPSTGETEELHLEPSASPSSTDQSSLWTLTFPVLKDLLMTLQNQLDRMLTIVSCFT